MDRERQRGHRLAILAVAASPFFGEVHGIAMAAAVAGGINFVPAFERLD